MIRKIDLLSVERIAHELAIKMMEWNEPIPPFSTRFPGKLESCIEAPFQTFDGKDLYPTLTEQAAMLFYTMIKSHPFQNGNKRIAVTTLLTFLFVNGHWLQISSEDLYLIATRVASSTPEEKDAMMFALNKVFGKSIVVDTEKPASP